MVIWKLILLLMLQSLACNHSHSLYLIRPCSQHVLSVGLRNSLTNFNHQSKARFSRRLVDSTTNVPTLERHSQEQGAHYKNRFKMTCAWKIMRSPMNAFPWLHLICCVCQRCSGGGNSGLTLLNAKALIIYTLISLTDWLQTWLVGSYPLWNSRFLIRTI